MSCNRSNMIAFDEKEQCIIAEQGSIITRFDIEQEAKLYHVKLKKGVHASRKICFENFQDYYYMYDVYPKKSTKAFVLEKNQQILITNSSYGLSMTSMKLQLFCRFTILHIVS